MVFSFQNQGRKQRLPWFGRRILETEKKCVFTVSVLTVFDLSIQVYAVGDRNLDGGGGSMGQGPSRIPWSPGNKGVRVTVIRAESHDPVTRPIDLTNKCPNITLPPLGKSVKCHIPKEVP